MTTILTMMTSYYPIVPSARFNTAMGTAPNVIILQDPAEANALVMKTTTTILIQINRHPRLVAKKKHTPMHILPYGGGTVIVKDEPHEHFQQCNLDKLQHPMLRRVLGGSFAMQRQPKLGKIEKIQGDETR